MTDIKFIDNKIIFDGHADTIEECTTITALCDTLRDSKDFKTIEYGKGYAEFEILNKNQDLKFTPNGVDVSDASNDIPVSVQPRCIFKHFTGKQEYENSADLSMVEGNQVLIPEEGKLFSKVTVNKPSTLLPENIKKDIIIGGIKGTLNPQPALQDKSTTPTDIQQIVTADNGYYGLSSVTIKAIPSNYIVPSGDLSITANGTYNIKTYESISVSVPSVQPQLNAPTLELEGSNLTITNPSTNGGFVTTFKLFDGSNLFLTTAETLVDISQHISSIGTHFITARAVGTNFMDSEASNSKDYIIKQLTTPSISLVEGETTVIQIDTIDDNAQTIEVYANSTKIGEVTKQ